MSFRRARTLGLLLLFIVRQVQFGRHAVRDAADILVVPLWLGGFALHRLCATPTNARGPVRAARSHPLSVRPYHGAVGTVQRCIQSCTPLRRASQRGEHGICIQTAPGWGRGSLPHVDDARSSLEPLRSAAVWVLVLRLTLRFMRLV